jgi:hypothetical protein
LDGHGAGYLKLNAVQTFVQEKFLAEELSYTRLVEAARNMNGLFDPSSCQPKRLAK